MPTSQTLAASTPGPVRVHITSPVGGVTVTIDPALTHATLTVSTPDDDGAFVEAVANATLNEAPPTRMHSLLVDVPEPRSGTHHRKGHSPIAVHVQLPSDESAIRLTTNDADLHVHGNLHSLTFATNSGSLHAEGVHMLAVSSEAGRVEVQRIDHSLDVAATTGDVNIGAYNGTSCRIHTGSGDVSITATPAATGDMEIITRTGHITARGTSSLNANVTVLQPTSP
ncbi:DUF4097 domain-containing protein (plasmid) [Streptomyces globisporus]|uniref:DUF4097 family beta strand repeat-containing protein n=1 Tax=Streptomyces globisporus TaxID=1908 RepID=UPI002F90FA48|nr:DUF4097 domain-containing protein [Streptomyces globisporus]